VAQTNEACPCRCFPISRRLGLSRSQSLIDRFKHLWERSSLMGWSPHYPSPYCISGCTPRSEASLASHAAYLILIHPCPFPDSLVDDILIKPPDPPDTNGRDFPLSGVLPNGDFVSLRYSASSLTDLVEVICIQERKSVKSNHGICGT
jgi:hypothetical protein